MKERRKHLILVWLHPGGPRRGGLPGRPGLACPHKKPTLGLDLQGGLEVVLKAVPPKGHKLTSDDLSRSIDIMRKRIDKLGVSGAGDPQAGLEPDRHPARGHPSIRPPPRR